MRRKQGSGLNNRQHLHLKLKLLIYKTLGRKVITIRTESLTLSQYLDGPQEETKTGH